MDPEINNLKNRSAKYSNVLSLKSHFFIEEAFLYGNLEKIRFNHDNILLSKRIYEKIENNENIGLDFLHKKVVILIPKINEKLFLNYYQFNINKSYNLVLVNYEPEQIIDKCLKSNLKLSNYN